MNPKPGDIVEVVWIDAAHVEVESTEEQLKQLEPCQTTSYGMLVINDKDRIVIAGSYNDDGERVYRDSICIPVGMIVSVTKLKIDKNAPKKHKN